MVAAMCLCYISGFMPHMCQSMLGYCWWLGIHKSNSGCECFDACHVTKCIIKSHLSLLSGEWEISAFDGSLKSRGMSIRYTVRPCDSGDLQQVERDGFEDDITDYIDQLDLSPRGLRPQNHAVLARVCKKLNASNSQSANTSCQAAKGQLTNHLRKVSEGEIPKDVLEEIERDGKWTMAQNETEPGEKKGGRQRRQAEGNQTVISSEASNDAGTGTEIEVENRTDTSSEINSEERSEIPSEKNGTKEELEESNEILLNYNALLNRKFSTVEPVNSEEMDENLSLNHIQLERERLTADMLDDNNATSLDLALEYDDYSQEVLFFCMHLTYLYKYIKIVLYAAY